MEFFTFSWSLLLGVLAVIVAAATAVHAAMTKDDVRSAIGWVGIAILSPFFGSFLYLVAGVNRIRRSAVRQRGRRSGGRARPSWGPVSELEVETQVGAQFKSLKILGDNVARLPFTAGNAVTLLEGGDATYAAMLEAIGKAERSIALQTYIFDLDPVGREIAEALAAAVARGVEVRVLIDGVGARYSRPPILGTLKRLGVTYALFNSGAFPLRLPYANLRTHRKILVVDASIGFTGGMNIRAAFTTAHSDGPPSRDTHFRFEGPVVSQLLRVFAGDWYFSTRERLRGPKWDRQKSEPGSDVFCRPIDSGPDEGIERTLSLILGALSVAQRRVRICTPYFLPDPRLVAALAVAARRGIDVDIVVPEENNLRIVGWAITAQLDQVVVPGCRVWRNPNPFDHSKLMAIDGAWSLVGSSNLDVRSLRLNFELDVEIMDRKVATAVETAIEARIAISRAETQQTLAARSLPARLRNRLFWLASPYL
jgi:cardiolipin synthase